jgi:hypothetical protein
MNTLEIIGIVSLVSSAAFVVGMWIGDNWHRWSKPREPGINRNLHQADEHSDWWMKDQADQTDKPGLLKRQAE